MDLPFGFNRFSCVTAPKECVGNRRKVTAAGGIVTITGTTRWPEVERAVPVVVYRVEGVKEVRSQVFVPIR